MSANIQFPKAAGIDNTLTVLREGYPFISNRVKRLNSDLFTTRFMGKKTIFMSGREAAELFYQDKYFKRKKVAPKRVQKTLFGQKAIQGLDGKRHLKRKTLFMSLLTPEYEKKFLDLCTSNLEIYSKKWEQKSSIVLYTESKKVLFESVCQWAGVPYDKKKVDLYAEDFGLMIYSFGSIGKMYWKGKAARKRAEKWIKKIIIAVREGNLTVDSSTPLYQMSMYEEVPGVRVDAQIAAVELINLLRPIIAISTYITFAGVALYKYPTCKEKLRDNDSLYREMFCQEVRRFYPFAPFVGAKVKRDFTWKGYEFKKNTVVILDIYGIDHDPRLWDEPYTFNPERFSERKRDLYDLIPQGGGNINTGHRCAGDMITLKTMEVFVDFLVNKLNYKVPKQNLTFSLRKIPTLPESGFIMSRITKVKNN